MASTETPLMRQYGEIKSRHSDALLFFRMGDFYELFFDDALVAAKALEIALTSRNKNDPNPVPMCGVPHHAAANYINRLVANGFKVAICEQLEDPSAAKGIVKRDVIRVVSPGTRLDPETLEAKAPNYAHAACLDAKGTIHFATCDFTTGKFWFGEFDSVDSWLAYAQTESLAELLFPETENGRKLLVLWREVAPRVFAQTVPAFYFEEKYASDRIKEQFEVASLKAAHPSLGDAGAAVGALIKYFQETQKAPRIPSVLKLDRWGHDQSMELDAATVRALELLPSKLQNTGRDASLLSLIDRTKTAMGGRLIRDWLLRPLTDRATIELRLDQVDGILRDDQETLRSSLSEIYDLERLLSRVSLGQGAQASGRELLALGQSLTHARNLSQPLNAIAQTQPENAGLAQLERTLQKALHPQLLELAQTALEALNEKPPVTTREGGIFKKGFRPELDELIELSENGEQWLANFEARERQATGISSLKVRFNRVFGYYIEITKANLSASPSHYIRKQTMVGGERFITEELKSFEEKILTAEKKRCDMEHALFREFCGKFAVLAPQIAGLARAIAEIDVIGSLATVASECGFVRPELNDSLDLEIEEGWHPTVSRMLEKSGASFVPNSVVLNAEGRFLLVTGPNMGGKSTVMRQTALIALLAQMGSFVPARAARLGVVDRIFTRIGANDNIAEGSSTFMVEMSEMSFILRHSTRRSLILIDEIGRGTSTYDGMSLAWALAADIAERIQARTLFATHYHELTQLAERYPSIANARVAVHVGTGDDGAHAIRFLYRLEPGVAERSYGILVAKLAGLPSTLLADAEHMLDQLEAQARQPGSTSRTAQLKLLLDQPRRPQPVAPQAPAAASFKEDHPLEKWIKGLELNQLTPMQAMTQLAEWKQRLN